MTCIAAGDETPSEGRISNDLDPKLPSGLQEADGLVLDVQGEWRVLDLDGGDGVDGVCPAKGRSRDLGESEVFDLPGPREDEHPDLWIERDNHSLDEFGHLSDGVFNWDRGVSTVEVVKVDVIDTQSRQRLVQGLVDVLRVGLHKLIGFSMGKAKLRSEEDLVALSGLLEPMCP